MEEGTALAHAIKLGKEEAPEDELALQHFILLQEWAQDKGWNHYEISNLAKPGNEAFHNSSYWRGVEYLGLGPSAHGYKNNTRYWNVSNNALYRKSLEKGELPQETERLHENDLWNEKVMTQLRLNTGLSLKFLDDISGESQKLEVLNTIESMLLKGKLIQKNNALIIPENQRFFSDGIAAELFLLSGE